MKRRNRSKISKKAKTLATISRLSERAAVLRLGGKIRDAQKIEWDRDRRIHRAEMKGIDTQGAEERGQNRAYGRHRGF